MKQKAVKINLIDWQREKINEQHKTGTKKAPRLRAKEIFKVRTGLGSGPRTNRFLCGYHLAQIRKMGLKRSPAEPVDWIHTCDMCKKEGRN